MSADSFEEIKLRLESLIDSITCIKWDWFHRFSDEEEAELMDLVEEAKSKLEELWEKTYTSVELK